MDRSWEIVQALLLVSRLERLSADSVWAHRASGMRGSLLQTIDEYKSEKSKANIEKLHELMNIGNFILEQAIKSSFAGQISDK